MVLTKAELVKLLTTDKVNINKEDAIQLVELFFDEIRIALENGEEVKLSGFGSFRTRKKKERPGRNLKTGKFAIISARRVVTFYASRKLKAKMMENKTRSRQSA